MTIDQQQQAILSCCDQLMAALHTERPIDEIGPIRMRLAGLLHANLAAEECELTAPIRRLSPADRPNQFAVITAEAAYLRSLYSEHVRRWTPQSIVGNPQEYAEQASELVRELKAHLVKKRAVLPEWRRAASAVTRHG